MTATHTSSGRPGTDHFARQFSSGQAQAADHLHPLSNDEKRELLMNLDTLTPPPMNQDGANESGGGKAALLVDDHPELLTLIAPWLTSLGYRVLTASDGKEAQGMMMEQGITNVDLLITDLDMPRLQGDELARWFIRENPEARVLVISGHQADKKLCEGIAFLQKPFSREGFMARVGDLLGRSDVTAVVPSFEHTSL